MHSPEAKFSSLVSLYRHLAEPKWVKNEIIGEIKIEANIIKTLVEAEEMDLIAHHFEVDNKTISLDPKTLNRHIGSDIKITLYPMREAHNSIFFARDMNDLLAVKTLSYQKPNFFYLADKDFFSSENTSDFNVDQYYNILRMIEFLRVHADHSEEDATRKLTLYFLQQTKIAIPIEYTEADLNELVRLDDLIQSVSTPEHKEQKSNMLSSSITQHLEHVKIEKRFPYLLKNFQKIVESYKKSLKLYLREFSIDKLREDIQFQKSEYTRKINNIISDIQGKLLAIPVALLLVGGQMKEGSSHFISNLAIAIGACVFSLLMFLLLHNQKHTLRQIRVDLKSQEVKLNEEYADIAGIFGDTYKRLSKRIEFQAWTIRIIGILVWISLFGSLVLLGYYTPEIKNFF